MFFVCQRTDTLPELRVLINTDHVIAVTPVSGGNKSRLVMANGETWEVNLPFTRAISQFRNEPEMIPPINPSEQAPGVPRTPAEPPRRG